MRSYISANLDCARLYQRSRERTCGFFLLKGIYRLHTCACPSQGKTSPVDQPVPIDFFFIYHCHHPTNHPLLPPFSLIYTRYAKWIRSHVFICISRVARSKLTHTHTHTFHIYSHEEIVSYTHNILLNIE